MDETNFYFGDLEFHQVTQLDDFEDLDVSDRSEIIRQRVYDYVNNSDIIYRESDGYWRFGRCITWRGYIIGKLGKIFTEERTTWNAEIEDYVTIEEEIEVADVSLFVVNPNAEGIAFNRKLHTGSTKFAEAFAVGYNQYHHLEDELNIQLIRTGGDKHYSDILQDVRKVLSIDFDLEPVNPSADEEMEILDDHIKKMNAQEFGIDAESEEGLNYEEDLIRSGFALSDDGNYGNYIIRYEKGGEKKSYDSRGDYATKSQKDPDDLEDLKTIADVLIEELDDLLDEHRSDDD